MMSKVFLGLHNSAIGFRISASDLDDNNEQLCHYYRYELFHFTDY